MLSIPRSRGVARAAATTTQPHTRSTLRQELLRDNRVYSVEPPQIGLIKSTVRISDDCLCPIVLKNSIAGFGMKQYFAINASHCNKRPQGDGKEQQYYKIDPPLSIRRLFQHNRPFAAVAWGQLRGLSGLEIGPSALRLSVSYLRANFEIETDASSRRPSTREN